MRIAVFGTTGGIGAQLPEQARQGGDEVCAVVRNPAKLRTGQPGSPGESDHPDHVARSGTAGCDAVVSALGPRGDRGPTTVCSAGVASIVRAMRDADVRRLVVVSAGGIDNAGEGPLLIAARPI